jgi:hypothetical protein
MTLPMAHEQSTTTTLFGIGIAFRKAHFQREVRKLAGC